MTEEKRLKLLKLAAEVAELHGPWEGSHPLNAVIHDLQPEPKVVVPLDYLRSFDAALSLVPPGLGYQFRCASEPRPDLRALIGGVVMPHMARFHRLPKIDVDAFADTLPQAIVSAALLLQAGETKGAF